MSSYLGNNVLMVFIFGAVFGILGGILGADFFYTQTGYRKETTLKRGLILGIFVSFGFPVLCYSFSWKIVNFSDEMGLIYYLSCIFLISFIINVNFKN